MAEVIISDDEDYPPQLLTPPSSSNRGSVIEATRSKQNAPKSDEGVFLNQTGSQQNMKLEIFSCPMCPQNFVSYEELQSHANECIDRDPRVTGKMYENRNLDLDMSEDKKFMKLKQKNRGKGKGLDKAGEKKIMKVKICKEKSQGGKGKGKGGKPTLIPSLDDLVNFRGETIKLRLLLLQLGVETAKINVTELREGKHDIKWNRGFVTEIIKEEIAGADEWNEYTLKKRMRDAERDVDKFTMSKKEAHQTGMGDLDGDIDPTMLPIYENTKYTKPKTEIEIQMGHLKSELDKLKDDIERVHLQKYKKSQPNPKLEIKAQRLKKICNPEKSDDEVSDPEIAERETIKEVFQNQESEDNPEINGIKGTSTKTLRGTLSNKNAEKYEQSRRCRENSVRASKKEEESRRGFHGVTEINRQGEISISEPDDDDPLEVTINKFLKKQIKKSSNQTETNQMPPPAAPAVQAVPFYPYAMGMPYGGFGYPQPYMTAGGYPYGMTSGSGPDASNGDDPGSEPAPHLMQYNPYGGLLPSAGPGAVGGFPPGAVGGFPPGVVGGFPPGAVGGFPPGAVGGVAPGAVGGFQPGAVGGFQHGAVGGFQHGAGRGFPPGTGQGSGAGRGFPPGAGQGSGVGQIFQPGTVRGSGVGQGFPPGTGRGFQPGAVGGFHHDTVGGFQPGAGRGFLPGAGRGSGARQRFPPGAGRGAGAGQGFPPGAGRGSGAGESFPPGAGPAGGGLPSAKPGLSGHAAGPDIGVEMMVKSSVDGRANRTSERSGRRNRKSVISAFGEVPDNSGGGEEFGFSAGTAGEPGFGEGHAGVRPDTGLTGMREFNKRGTAASAASSSGIKKSDIFSSNE